MLLEKFKPLCKLMLSALPLLLVACATPSLPSPPVAPPRIPPLPAEALPSPLPGFCSPSCLSALNSDLENWRKRLTGEVVDIKPASPSTTK